MIEIGHHVFKTKTGGCMKNIIVLSLLFITVACFGCNQHDHHAQQKQDQKQTQLNPSQLSFAMIMLPTMQCNTCAETIQKTVEQVKGVKSVSIDLKEKIACEFRSNENKSGEN